jgi:hypothetical protein
MARRCVFLGGRAEATRMSSSGDSAVGIKVMCTLTRIIFDSHHEERVGAQMLDPARLSLIAIDQICNIGGCAKLAGRMSGQQLTCDCRAACSKDCAFKDKGETSVWF